MMHIVFLVVKSILNRKLTIALTVFSIALSIMLLLGVERLRTDARHSFSNTISGTDLVVGARTGAVQLLLYSVFRIGNATNNVSWNSYQAIENHPLVSWTVPLSLGDSHRGFRVLGTNTDYFKYYRYQKERTLEFASGTPFAAPLEAVIGADVAEKLQYTLNQEIVLAHGSGEVDFVLHKDKPFRVVGILQKTGTPVDRTVHVSLEGIDAIHAGWETDTPALGNKINIQSLRKMRAQPRTITAILVGLESRLAVFRVQRFVNDYPKEPLLAALPGVALQELWDTMAIAEKALLAVSVLVVLVGISGMTTAVLTSLNERRREMAILRSLGARPWHIFALFVTEAATIMLIATLLGVAALYAIQLAAQPLVQTQLGIYLPINPPSTHEFLLIATAIGTGVLVGLLPAYRAYRYSLADGMTIRL